MKRKYLAWLMCFLAFSLILTGTYEVSAQKVLEDRITQSCADALYKKPAFLENGGEFASQLGGIFNIQAQLPFVPASCAKDKAGDPKDKYAAKSGTTALPVKYFPFVLLRVYRFMISLAFYMFGLGLIVTGVLIQAGVFSSNFDYFRKIKQYLNNSIVGISTVLFAYYFVYILLWIFNASELLDQNIIG